MTGFLVCKTSTLKEYLSLAYYHYRGNQQQHSLTLRTFLYLIILKKFQFSRSILSCFNMYLYGDRQNLSGKMEDSSSGT